MISIGYATCHWCHVMARETFSDPAAASGSTSVFVSIKVDREEHHRSTPPTLRSAGCFQLAAGMAAYRVRDARGPHLLRRDYLPPQPMQGIPSFLQVAEAVLEAWSERHEEVLQSAEGLQDALRRGRPTRTRRPADGRELGDAVTELVGYEGWRSTRVSGEAPSSRRARAAVPEAAGLHGRTERPNSPSAPRATRGEPATRPREGGFFRYATRR